MSYNREIISYLQSNNILALKLDNALSGVGKAFVDQIGAIGSGAQRVLFYTSCFTDEYMDVCRKQSSEDIRFTKSIYHLLQHIDVVYEMLKIYFDEILKHKTSEQLEHIKEKLMAVNIHIATSSLTNHGFALAIAASVATGLNVSLEVSALVGKRAAGVVAGLGMYGVVQKAADSADRLRLTHPKYYAALYAKELEMMFFLVEPVFKRAGVLDSSWLSNDDISNVIERMIRW
ncbi:hypothetical protein [Candidatus Pantoea multigeneris]|uniref:Uncharacterized protein n=1 Tax=Candidatus Pantoea multigeneris TaxID=2608357 RepID=A0ABX0REU3_9GAMM|nr:hypothetical protein [Pantoea multigeneris]